MISTTRDEWMAVMQAHPGEVVQTRHAHHQHEVYGVITPDGTGWAISFPTGGAVKYWYWSNTSPYWDELRNWDMEVFRTYFPDQMMEQIL